MDPIEKANALIEALPYLQAFRGMTFIIKMGGSAMVVLKLLAGKPPEPALPSAASPASEPEISPIPEAIPEPPEFHVEETAAPKPPARTPAKKAAKKTAAKKVAKPRAPRPKKPPTDS